MTRTRHPENPIVLDARTVADHFPGIGRYTRELACALARQAEHGRLVLLLNPGQRDSRFDVPSLSAETGVRVFFTRWRPFSSGEQLMLPRTLRRLAPVATHFPYLVMPYRAPSPKVLTLHDVIPERLPSFFSLRSRILYKTSLRLALRSADIIVCLSEATREDLKQVAGIDASAVRVVPAGVSDRFSPRAAEAVVRIKAAYSLPSEYLLYVGSDKPHKNIPKLVDAMAFMPNSPQLVIAGSSGQYDEARSRARERSVEEKIRFLGPVNEEDLPALYCGAKVFVFPSLYEGFGLPPLEAMACGTPVAASGIPCLREVLGSDALYFDPGKAESIAAAIEQILDSRQLSMDLAERGAKRAASMTWDAAAQRMLEVYSLAAAGNTARRP